MGLIKFNMALRHREAIGLAHQVADLLAHPPGGLVGDAKLALQFLARDTVPHRGKEEDRIEPDLQRRAAVLKDRPGAWVQVVAATRASVSLPVGELVKRRQFAAMPANVLHAMPYFHDVMQACIAIGEPIEEIANGKLL